MTPVFPCFRHTEPATLILCIARNYAKGYWKGIGKVCNPQNMWNSPAEKTCEEKLALKWNKYPTTWFCFSSIFTAQNTNWSDGFVAGLNTVLTNALTHTFAFLVPLPGWYNTVCSNLT